MKTYPGLPEPQVEIVFDYDDSRERYQGKAEFRIASLHLCGNTGTYVDAPIHRYRGGTDLASLSLDLLADLSCCDCLIRALGAKCTYPAWRIGALCSKSTFYRLGWRACSPAPRLEAWPLDPVSRLS